MIRRYTSSLCGSLGTISESRSKASSYLPCIIRASGILKFRWISLLIDCGLKIDLKGFETRSDKGSARRKAGIVSGINPHTDFGNESGTKNNILTAKKGREIRNRLNSSLNAYSVSFIPLFSLLLCNHQIMLTIRAPHTAQKD
ncbi:hypothetical protein DRQ25_07470 [Candidatus Fermentibacteria bacterium]|nr:MAG: hypothetical protein DRQ25_07470 [Candidatus Fermentibacteria bacterium]